MSDATPGTDTRVPVMKTHKLYIGGAFPRSESGRTIEVAGHDGAFLANAARASRKDVRDAVVAARTAFGGWAARTAYNRGQVLYRVAEVMEGRRDQLVADVRAATGATGTAAGAEVDAAIDRWVWYAGWTDKLAQVEGSSNPVAGPYFNVSIPEPTGVVAAIAPDAPPLLGLVSVLAPVLATGSTAVVVASEASPLVAVTLSEILATSDVPGGVANVLTGRHDELVVVMARHGDVDGLDLSGYQGDPTEAERGAADHVARVRRPEPDADWMADPGLGRLRSWLEIKTVWHPAGT